MDHLNKEKLEAICNRLWNVHGSLNGLGSLFTQGTRDVCLDDREFYGIGLILKNISGELAILEDILRTGRDSGAEERNGDSLNKPN
ncbi:MAG: hypothetical protein KDD50_10845 [Bdellovibrionales bacterium]|nr:hypothetical protein [Bdellovibrionales bacterium]MCB0414823.1 hypothetical protein [Bdellovibrionales bacterium]